MIRFYIPHRREGEKIILLIRRHPFVLFKRVFFWLVAAAIPVVILFLVGGQRITYEQEGFLYPLLLVLASIYYLYIWLFVFNGFVDYYLDVWIVTDVRIVNIEQRQLFSRVISEHELERIQDVTAEAHGILPTFLNYGEVHVQTAGEQQRFIFKQVPNPQEVKRQILSICDYRKKFIQGQEASDIDKTPAVVS